jgi:hypothetical protein
VIESQSSESLAILDVTQGKANIIFALEEDGKVILKGWIK